MRLKRLYNKKAPPGAWTEVADTCPACQGRGKAIHPEEDQIVDCPECTGKGTITSRIPPVRGVIVEHYSQAQKFTPRLVLGGTAEGWLTLGVNSIKITGVNLVLTYQVIRKPGRYGQEQINFYDCRLITAEPVAAADKVVDHG